MSLIIASIFYLTRQDDSDTLAELFHSSSTAEQSAVNRSVAGSNPACGDTLDAIRTSI